MERDHASNRSIEGTMTILFADLEASTALAYEHGDRALMAAVTALRDVLVELTVEFGGHRTGNEGDGSLVLFTSCRRALRFATALRSEAVDRVPTGVKVGLHTGEVIRSRNQVFGLAINKASRISDLAAGGEVKVSAMTRALIGRDQEFHFDEAGLAQLKGLPEPEPVYCLRSDCATSAGSLVLAS